MMKKFVLYLFSFCMTVYLYPQSVPFLLRINGEEISHSEFEAAYRAHDLYAADGRINDFLQHFIDRKLKIVEARQVGLDTTAAYQAVILKYERENDAYLLSALQPDNSLWEQYCEQQKSLPQPAKVKVMQIFKVLPQNSSGVELERIIRSMEDIHARLVRDTSACFSDYVNEHSEDKRCVDVGWLETTPAFEQTVFGMNEGEISTPFITPSGVHIVKVIQKRALPADDELSDSFRLRMMRRYKSGRDPALLEHLKTETSYTPDLRRINELLTVGRTEGVLFTIGGKAYTDADFLSFAEGNPKGIHRQFDDFVAKTMCNHLPDKYVRKSSAPNPSAALLEEDFLISEITRREITEKAQSKAGLSAYFSVNKKTYRWQYPRFKGVVLHAKNKRQYRSAKKLVKKMPFEDWTPLITQYFHSEGIAQIEVEQQIFELGDNAFVDELVFKSGHASPHPSFPFAFVIGKKITTPETDEDVREAVLADYEHFLEMRWLRQLRERHRVEINEEVLKTVNNDRCN